MGELQDAAPPYSYLYPVERLPGEGRVVKMSIESDDCEKIAAFLGVNALSSLSAMVTLKPFAGGDMVRVTGTVQAHVVQTCGVTLQQMNTEVDETIDRQFSFASKGDGEVSELEVDPDGVEPPDPVIDGHIDLGDVLVEQLALGIDPFPRLPGAEFSAPKAVDGSTSMSPFAVLEGLKTGKSTKR